MNKRGWLAVASLGLIASANTLAGNEIGALTAKPQPAFERQQAVAGVDSMSYAGTTTGSGRGRSEASKLSVGTEFLSLDSNAGPGNTYAALALAALGALAISATRRRGR